MKTAKLLMRLIYSKKFKLQNLHQLRFGAFEIEHEDYDFHAEN